MSRKIWLYDKLATQQDNKVIKTSWHIPKVCESVIKERRNLLYYWLCHTIWQVKNPCHLNVIEGLFTCSADKTHGFDSGVYFTI